MMPTNSLLLPSSLDFLHLQARRRGNAGGIRFRGAHTAFGALAEATQDLAEWLSRKGVGRGTHVAIFAANEPAMVVMTYAVWSLGAVAVPIGVRSSVDEVTTLLTQSRCTALLCDPPRVESARAAATTVAIPVFACEPTLPLRPRVARRQPLQPATAQHPRPQDLAVLAYTSGTTGVPKGVMISHGNLLWSSLACSTARGDSGDSVGVCLSPLTHTPVFVSHLLCRILHGSTAVLLEKFETDAVLEAVARYTVSDVSLIAGMVFDVIQLRTVPAAVRQAVKKVTVGGAATPMAAKRDLAKIFVGAEVIEAYGQSESTNGVTMARGTSVFDHEGTIGRPNPYVMLRVRRSDGSFAGDGEEGELVIGGPTVMQGYYRDKAATAAAIRDGWLHTGDLGRCDQDGYFYITGRVKNLIISGGENISPVEVEDVLRLHPQVADVAVIGTPHPKWGEQVTAVIVCRGATPPLPEELIAFAGQRLAAFKKPRRIEFLPRLPRNAANKVQTNLLKQQFAAG